MAVSNLEFLDLTLIDAFKRVVVGLGEAGLMVGDNLSGNPEFLDLTIMDAFKRVVAGLGEAGLMVAGNL